MEIKIITIHDPDVNYGSTLQSCGTYNFVSSLGYDVEIINYKPNYKRIRQRIKKVFINFIFLKKYFIRRQKVSLYFKQHAKLTKLYRSYKELIASPPIADTYITGSDVIWNRDVNPEGNDPAFFLGFVEKGKRISYAPSMGEIQSKSNLGYIIRQIENFDFISVREEKSREQLIGEGLKNVHCVLDPVFLMDSQYYRNQMLANQYGEYILVYFMSENILKRKSVEKIHLHFGLKVISFGGFKKKCDCDLFIRDAGVEDFLTLIDNAKFIITDSFHCISFSLIFNKQFCYIPAKDSSMRIENLLQYVDLEERIINNIDNIERIFEVIDFNTVNEKIENKVEESRSYLKNALLCLE